MHCLKSMSKPLPSPKASILCVADVFQVTWSPSCLSLRYITEMHWPCQEGLGRRCIVQGLLGKVNHKTRTFSRLFHIHEMHMLALFGLFTVADWNDRFIILMLAVAFDPASFYGHHEFDLAIAGMFGGFSKAFYDAYHKEIPKEKGFNKRHQLYQLFHHLNHW